MIKERSNEISRIRSFLSKPKLGGLFIYGKENTGKSSLVHTACKDLLAKKIFFNVGNENKETVLAKLKAKCAAAFSNVDQGTPNDVSQSIKFLFEQSVNQKIILVIDDIHLLYNVEPEILAFFENFRSRFKGFSNIKVICISSYPEIRAKYDDPRQRVKQLFDEFLEIDNFDYLKASSFYPRALLEDKLTYYSVFGGSPFYNSMINPSKNLETNLKELVLYKHSPLRNKIESDLNKVTSKKYEADGLLEILARKQFSRYGELKAAFKGRGLTGDFDYMLNKLIEIGIIAKKAPLHYENDKKKFFYMFSDPLFDFFYSHVFMNTEQDALPEEIDKTYDSIIKGELKDRFFPRRLPFIAMEFLKREGEKGKFKEEVMNIGPYFPSPLTLEYNGSLVVETLSGNYYVLVNSSNHQLDKNAVEKFAYSLYEKQKPYQGLVLISRGMFATNVNRAKYMTYRLAAMYSKI